MPLESHNTTMKNLSTKFKKQDFNDSDGYMLNCLGSTPPSHLFVVRCVLSQPKEKMTKYTTFTRIVGNCKLIVDSGRCLNVLPSKWVITLGYSTLNFTKYLG